jgi:hypothetical protein
MTVEFGDEFCCQNILLCPLPDESTGLAQSLASAQ